MQEIRPTCMSSVPRLWEKIYQGVQDKIAASPKVQRSLMQDALKNGYALLGRLCFAKAAGADDVEDEV